MVSVEALRRTPADDTVLSAADAGGGRTAGATTRQGREEAPPASYAVRPVSGPRRAKQRYVLQSADAF